MATTTTSILSTMQPPIASIASTQEESTPLEKVQERTIDVVREALQEMKNMPPSIKSLIEYYVDIDFIDIFSKAGITFKYVPGVLLPKNESPSQRELRVRQAGTDDILSRILRKLNYAKSAFELDDDKGFYYREAPLVFPPAVRRSIRNYEMAVSSMQGVRLSMEDRHLMTELELDGGIKVPVLGVFDGHGGSGAAEYVEASLSSMLQQTLAEFNPGGLDEEGIWNALKLCCVRLSIAYRQTGKIDGTTVVFAIVLFDKLWILNLGDSRAVLYNNGLFIQLTEDAKPDTPRFKNCVEDRGGKVIGDRVVIDVVSIATARAVGDVDFGDCISARGEVTMLPLSFIEPGSILLLGCDGVFDVTSSWQLLKALHEHFQLPLEKFVRNCVHSAIFANSRDNVTLAAMRFP